MKTFVPKLSEISKKWYVLDVGGKILGRQATRVARVLMGKNKPTYIPHLDTGDFVIVINADKVVLTGKKPVQKAYYHFTGYPGGLRKASFTKMVVHKPERLFRDTVWGMLPKGRLGRKMLKKLFVYRGPSHPHQAQKPEPLVLN